jgi:hypothetical protein
MLATSRQAQPIGDLDDFFTAGAGGASGSQPQPQPQMLDFVPHAQRNDGGPGGGPAAGVVNPVVAPLAAAFPAARGTSGSGARGGP